ncbi:MAG: YcxB family protein [Blautia sp.]|nr:YcxB family protein [Blautia sp.]MCM1201240.1 YcxB family protein [Bacteroides fragilis]
MKYQFKNEVTAMDFWRLVMRRTYRSTAGVCNIVFTAAMFVLVYRFWNTAADVYKGLMLAGCFLFPVIQPIVIYGKSRKQAAALPKGMELGFDEGGLHVKTPEASSDIPWSSIKNVVREFHMIVIFSDNVHGYLLTDKMLGAQKEEFYEYVISRADVKK